MSIKLFDSELKVMEVLWEKGDLAAGKIAKSLKVDIGWNRNTTYTVIKKCIAKGAISRYEPNFMCSANISKEQAQQYETKELIDKMFDGSTEKFFAAFIGNQNLSKEEIEKLKKMVTKSK
ncbi:penicillin-binding protein [Vallitalea longa]|uniref:Penicillin-binding protein n=1 Tax=Vallitalea longa TaxID=2936439 RepID=A0A9W6DG34_9FIRM|nr:BlaI/MecI/CopY family transcriptional regulator [Vallitalea longa]GKX29329.1 penicillin-binding protein [Vallitalea longa]